jgi:WD40 repeat protein
VVVVWDTASGREQASLKGHGGDVWSVLFTSDGKTLVSVGGDWEKPSEIKLWDTASWRQRGALKHGSEVLCLAIAPQDEALAAGTWDQSVIVWDGAALGKPHKAAASKR